LTPGEIMAIAPDFIQEMGLNVSLTPSRANGFYNIFQTMQKKALAYYLGSLDSGTQD
jgi:cysteine desulfuration protein SufE